MLSLAKSMKSLQLLACLLASACVTAPVSAQSNAKAANNSGIVVKAVSPRAWATGPDGKSFKLQAGMTLPEGSRIQTGGSGSVDVYLGNALAAFQVTASSDLTIQKASAATAATPTAAAVPADVQITVKAGGLVGNTTGMKADTKFSVTTPTSVLSVTPAEFALTSDGSVVVKSGTVQVQSPVVQNGQTSTKTTTVAANQEFTPATAADGAGAKVQATPPEVKAALETKFSQVAKVETTGTGTQGNQNPNQVVPATQPTNPNPGSGGTPTGNGGGVNLTSTLQAIGDKNSNK